MLPCLSESDQKGNGWKNLHGAPDDAEENKPVRLHPENSQEIAEGGLPSAQHLQKMKVGSPDEQRDQDLQDKCDSCSRYDLCNAGGFHHGRQDGRRNHMKRDQHGGISHALAPAALKRAAALFL